MAMKVGLGLALALLAMPVFARDNGQWGHDPATSEWFKSLRSPTGFPCCDYSDGTRLEDPGDYVRNNDGSYEVRIGPEWFHVEEYKVIKGTNRVGYAIIWRSPTAHDNIYCFLPGSGT